MNFLIINSDVEAVNLLVELLEHDLKMRKLLNKNLTGRNHWEEVNIDILVDISEERLIEFAWTDTCVIMETEIEEGTNMLELAGMLRQVDERIPIVFYTKTNDHAMECYDLDLTYYLLQPTDEISVHRMVTCVLQQLKIEL